MQGDTGAQGMQGDTGAQGMQGDTGPQGMQGDTGPQGMQGDTGPQGMQGDTGPQGEMGPTGPQGELGPTGPVAFIPAYAFVYTTTTQQIILGGTVPFTNIGAINGFTLIAPDTLQADVPGIYWEIKTIDTLEPNSFALYINGVLFPGAWFGANATAQDVREAIVPLNAGDILQLRNQSSQGGTVTLAPLGSGSNPSVGQTTAAFSIFRIA